MQFISRPLSVPIPSWDWQASERFDRSFQAEANAAIRSGFTASVPYVGFGTSLEGGAGMVTDTKKKNRPCLVPAVDSRDDPMHSAGSWGELDLRYPREPRKHPAPRAVRGAVCPLFAGLLPQTMEIAWIHVPAKLSGVEARLCHPYSPKRRSAVRRARGAQAGRPWKSTTKANSIESLSIVYSTEC